MSRMPIYMDEHAEWPRSLTMMKTVQVKIDHEEAMATLVTFFDNMTPGDVAKLSSAHRDGIAKQIKGWLQKFEDCRTEAEKAGE